jgi:hypothetical protein
LLANTWEKLATRKLSASFLLFLEKSFTKMLRPVLRDATHDALISPSFFASLAAELSEKKGVKVVFCQSDQLSGLLRENEEKHHIILAGDSDYECTENDYKLMVSRKEVTFFVQNLNFPETSNVFVLPIGIEDPKWAKSGMPWNLRFNLERRRLTERVLIGPYRVTDPIRKSLLDMQSDEFIFVQRQSLATFHYARLALIFLYVACPRGNGIDTHRVWETLTRGSLPIVLESPWSRNLARYLPIVILKKWDKKELQNLRSEPRAAPDPSKLTYLSTTWWRQRLVSIISDHS